MPTGNLGPEAFDEDMVAKKLTGGRLGRRCKYTYRA
jgi:hypothetical protein